MREKRQGRADAILRTIEPKGRDLTGEREVHFDPGRPHQLSGSRQLDRRGGRTIRAISGIAGDYRGSSVGGSGRRVERGVKIPARSRSTDTPDTGPSKGRGGKGLRTAGQEAQVLPSRFEAASAADKRAGSLALTG